MLKTFILQDNTDFRDKLLHYLQKKEVFCLLDSNRYYSGKDFAQKPYYHSYDILAADSARKILKCNTGNAFQELEIFQKENQGQWIFGYFGYDLKNELEKLESANMDNLAFDDLYFFVPETLILVKDKEITIETKDEFGAEKILEDIEQESRLMKPIANLDLTTLPFGHPSLLKEGNKNRFSNRIDKDRYLETVEKLRNHIIEGDVYEVSFCQEFFAENSIINPFDVYKYLCQVSPQPFGAFMRMDDRYILCASMERYLKKEGNKLISQPIKGTIRRGKDEEEDESLKKALLNDEKERAENVMIVDLVRNDLSRTCIPGTVKVEELFGIYDFPGVFQMISTVVGEMLPDKTGLDAIIASFPMGSMTGAPKIMAMDIIEQYEKSKRGVYSGALGYFAPNGDFDFNVVIRTLLYNAAKKYLSLHVGAAITYDSVPEKEYEECLVKIGKILMAVEGETMRQ